MTTQTITPMIPAHDLAAAVEFWAVVLGVEPTFVDGDRWAQFDLGPHRLALAGTDRLTDQAGVMLKVTDLEAARERVTETGAIAGEIVEGPHELRFLATSRFGEIVFYSPNLASEV